ncbi:MAG TPA: hypothetical protein VFV34_24175 [Blastocatellia bacterium]|nr:hypothetical protein [Blastocatellia bacterium]
MTNFSAITFAQRLVGRSALACFLILGLVSIARPGQSSDREHPAELAGDLVTGKIAADDKGEQFYSFIAGPGEVKLKASLAADSGRFGITIGLQPESGPSFLSLKLEHLKSKNEEASGHVVLQTRQRLVLRIAGTQSGGSGVYKIRLGGAVSFK